MVKTPFISVVMPVYNTAKYLSKSIGSVLNQTFQGFELLCINDGSTDNSWELLEKYASQDERVRIFNKKNEGVSTARNIGIEHALGNYIFFMDSDDSMPANALHVMIKALKNNPSAKYIKGNNLVSTSEGETVVTKWATQRKPYAGKLLSSEDFWHYIDLVRPCVWGILFDLAYIRYKNLRFETNIDFGEDALFLAQYIDNIPGVYINDPTYDYLFARQGSLCNHITKRTKEFYEKKAKCALSVTQKFYELKLSTTDKYRAESLNKYINWFASLSLSNIVRTTRFHRMKNLRILKGYCNTIKSEGGVMHCCLIKLYNNSIFCYLLNIIP